MSQNVVNLKINMYKIQMECESCLNVSDYYCQLKNNDNILKKPPPKPNNTTKKVFEKNIFPVMQYTSSRSISNQTSQLLNSSSENTSQMFSCDNIIRSSSVTAQNQINQINPIYCKTLYFINI